MPTRRAFLNVATAVLALSLAAPAAAQSDRPIPVVATFSILGDMVKHIGGEHVDVTTLVGPDGDTHVYQPTPADSRAVSEARVLVVNGLQFEGWLDRLIDASDFRGIRLVATEGIEPIAFDGEHDQGDNLEVHAEEAGHDHDHDDQAEAGHDDDHDHDEHAEAAAHDHDDDHDDEAGHDHHDHGAFDPHAWQSLGHAAAYVDNITAALAQADPANAADFYQNRAAYGAEIEALDAEIRESMAGLPADRRIVVTSHDAFQYFGRDYGLTFIAPQGLSTESEASAKDVARLIQQIRERDIRAVFIENVADPRLLKRIADETGAAIGGTLYPGALSGPDGPAPTYLDMMRHNATTLAQALAS
ncbi:MAG: metal ABC transporter substrate-binding protein [Rhodospirillaceae bacterium]|nr:metal ABC transporter substrate-binding protein [Rhodospirillaceae bacterium]